MLTQLAAGTPMPCVPVPTIWQKTIPDVIIGPLGLAALVETSCIRCVVGGQVEFQTSGQLPVIATTGAKVLLTFSAGQPKGWAEELNQHPLEQDVYYQLMLRSCWEGLSVY
ncbi:MAG TPA: hypothetical protein VK364_10240, partial [Hymenobacter sp.]|nr:hypothetical protein [Hymenobacter sp.]